MCPPPRILPRIPTQPLVDQLALLRFTGIHCLWFGFSNYALNLGIKHIPQIARQRANGIIMLCEDLLYTVKPIPTSLDVFQYDPHTCGVFSLVPLLQTILAQLNYLIGIPDTLRLEVDVSTSLDHCIQCCAMLSAISTIVQIRNKIPFNIGQRLEELREVHRLLCERNKLRDPAHGTPRLQPRRSCRVRCSAWLGCICSW